MTACSCPQRRSFLKTAVAAGISGAAVSVPVAAGVKMTLAPLVLPTAAKKKYAIAAVEALTATPQKFDIIDDLRDAWMTSPRQVIGSVLVAKDGDTIHAFSTLCPHAGCAILAGEQANPQTGNREMLLYCPCHSAHFALDGARLDQVSPRDLDSLETSVEGGTLYVTFVRFVCGVAEKKESS